MKTLDAYLRMIPETLTRDAVIALITEIVNEAEATIKEEYDNGYQDGYDEGVNE
jgi:hypothetical protein